MPLHEAEKKVFWETQTPIEVPSFGSLSQESLNQYMLLLSVIEDNLAEYAQLKGNLQAILAELQEVPITL